MLRLMAKDKEVSLNIDIGEIFIDSQIMMPLSLIINEMISNSLKYAFEDREKGTITVKLIPTSPSTNELYIADNGTGYTSEKVTTGLGSKLIQSFTRQLNGTVEKISGSGTTFKLTFENVISWQSLMSYVFLCLIGVSNKEIEYFTKQLGGTITKLNQSGTFYKLVFEKNDIL